MVDSSSFIVPKGKGKGRDVEKYEVFISFRDEDTRHTFASHLYNALCLNKITTYFGGQKGSDEISLDEAHLNAIQESKLSVIVFSENYACSPRCLEELVHVFQCKDQNRQLVVPVFYHVDPSHVRRQQGTYEAAFAAHQQRYEVKHWKDALERAANLSGWDSAVIRSESKLVGHIVKDIMKKLSLASSSDDYQEKGLVGIERRIEQIESLLQMGSSEDGVRILGICGVAGIGKTTLARVIFNRYSSQFQSCCFLENVEEEAKKRRLSQLQSKLFSELLEEKNLNMGNRFGKERERIRYKKVLIVLDAVDDMEQLEYLVGDGDWFGNGSRIIITTRDEQVLHNIEVDGTYKVEELNFDEALQLFSSKAFRGLCVPSSYMDLSKRVINQAKGIPSLLKDWGYRLHSKSTQVWESELSRQQKKLPIC